MTAAARLGSITVRNERTGVAWTVSPSHRLGWVNMIVTTQDYLRIERCVREFCGEYDEWIMVGRPIPRRFPRPSGWVCVLQVKLKVEPHELRGYDE